MLGALPQLTRASASRRTCVRVGNRNERTRDQRRGRGPKHERGGAAAARTTTASPPNGMEPSIWRKAGQIINVFLRTFRRRVGSFLQHVIALLVGNRLSFSPSSLADLLEMSDSRTCFLQNKKCKCATSKNNHWKAAVYWFVMRKLEMFEQGLNMSLHLNLQID